MSNHDRDSSGDPMPAPLSHLDGLRYKFVELSVVTDETIEQTVNEWVSQGWMLDAIRFVMTESSRRPAMAFISFVRDDIDHEYHSGVVDDPYRGGESGPH